ncbi:unnamed protein product [Rotaria sordida]|uniref:Uncharacterized protein n=1 Tax=Rotaria sordida TaxID=392033 RepID=A0A815LK85_9BILA|nr:unnamed protein product [Rotaria sordida]
MAWFTLPVVVVIVPDAVPLMPLGPLSIREPLSNGYIDNVALTTRAKSSVEILRDASLIAYYSFDSPNPTVDNGPNGLDGTSNNIVTATGRVNEAMRFLGSSSSYFRAYGFYQMFYGVVSLKPFSMAMWINPSSISYPASCSGSANGYYQGYVDELYIYNRELSQTDVTSLANP